MVSFLIPFQWLIKHRLWWLSIKRKQSWTEKPQTTSVRINLPAITKTGETEVFIKFMSQCDVRSVSDTHTYIYIYTHTLIHNTQREREKVCEIYIYCIHLALWQGSFTRSPYWLSLIPYQLNVRTGSRPALTPTYRWRLRQQRPCQAKFADDQHPTHPTDTRKKSANPPVAPVDQIPSNSETSTAG